MQHKLILELPDDLFNLLAETAKGTGSTPEQLAVEWLAAGSHAAPHDPVEDFIGAFPNSTGDWLDQHDKYLGQALFEGPSGATDVEG